MAVSTSSRRSGPARRPSAAKPGRPAPPDGAAAERPATDAPPPGRFDRAATFYEELAHVYSTGQIAAAKRSQIDDIRRGDRVLYVGVGGGEDAILAARRGAVVTCVDLSGRMLAQAEAKFKKHGLTGTFLRQDLTTLPVERTYDVVTANFFLNCFKEPKMKEMLAEVAARVRPGGKLLIADVARPQGNVFAKAFQQVHNGIGIGSFWMLGLVPLHPIYDYPKYMPAVGLTHVKTKTFRLAKVGPVAYWSLTAVKDV